jgi:hypothetical protein
MKIIIPTIGTRGDVQPYIALALGLLKAGHSVTLATHPCMRGLVESYGVDFAPIGPDIDIGDEAARIRANAPHWMVGFMRVMKFSFAMLEQAHMPVCWNVAAAQTWSSSRTRPQGAWKPTNWPAHRQRDAHPTGHSVKDPKDSLLKRIMGWLGQGWDC